MLVFLKLLLTAALKFEKKAIFLKINLDQTVGPRYNILKFQVLINIVAKSKECIEFITIWE